MRTPHASFVGKMVLQPAPVSIECLRVHITAHVLICMMIDRLVPIADVGERRVRAAFVRAYPAATLHDSAYMRLDLLPVFTRHQEDAHPVRVPLCDTEYGLFARSSAALRAASSNMYAFVLPRAADERRIDLRNATERLRHISGHGCLDACDDRIRGLARHTALARECGAGAVAEEHVDQVFPLPR